MVKLIFYYQVKQERVTFFSPIMKKDIKSESRNNEFVSNFLFFIVNKREHVRLKNKYNI